MLLDSQPGAKSIVRKFGIDILCMRFKISGIVTTHQGCRPKRLQSIGLAKLRPIADMKRHMLKHAGVDGKKRRHYNRRIVGCFSF